MFMYAIHIFPSADITTNYLKWLKWSINLLYVTWVDKKQTNTAAVFSVCYKYANTAVLVEVCTSHIELVVQISMSVLSASNMRTNSHESFWFHLSVSICPQGHQCPYNFHLGQSMVKQPIKWTTSQTETDTDKKQHKAGRYGRCWFSIYRQDNQTQWKSKAFCRRQLKWPCRC